TGELADVVVYVLNTSLSVEERRKAGAEAVERAASPLVGIGWWSAAYLHHATPAHEVMRGGSYDEQLTELAEHGRKTLAYFASIGYLEIASPPIGPEASGGLHGSPPASPAN